MPIAELKQVIVVRTDLNMRKGKLAAQVAHAAMAFLTRDAILTGNKVVVHDGLRRTDRDWLIGSYKKIVVGIGSEQELLDLIDQVKGLGIRAEECIDSGLTEFHGQPTLTCAAFGPDYPDKLDPLTGQLKLL